MINEAIKVSVKNDTIQYSADLVITGTIKVHLELTFTMN